MGVKNTLLDLNDHLFEQMERLNDDELTEDELKKEVERAKAMTGIATQIVGTANLVLEAIKINAGVDTENRVPRLLLGDAQKEKSCDE